MRATYKKQKLWLACAAWVFLLSGCAAEKQKKEEEIKDPALLADVAQDYLRKNEALRAIQTLTDAEKIQPENYDVNRLLGLAYLAKGSLTLAETYLLRALSFADSGGTEIRLYLAHLYVQTGEWERAIGQCHEVLSDPATQFPHLAYNYAGWAYFRKGDNDRAVEYLSNALKNKPDFILPHYNIAMVFMKMRRYGAAGNNFVDTLKLCTDCPKEFLAELYYRLGMAFHLTGNPAKASFYYEQGAKAAEKSPFGKECKKMYALETQRIDLSQ